MLGVLVALLAVMVREWRAMRRSLLMAAGCLCFIVGVMGFGRLVFHADRLIVQRAIHGYLPRIEDYRKTLGRTVLRVSPTCLFPRRGRLIIRLGDLGSGRRGTELLVE